MRRVNIWKERGEGGVNGHAVMTDWLQTGHLACRASIMTLVDRGGRGD